MRRIGVLTSGGDAPGMNAAVVSVARSAALYGIQLVGIKRGYNGLLRKHERLEDDMQVFDSDTILDIADQPGTYLRTARCDDFMNPDVRVFAANNLREMGVEGLVVIGGDGSFHGAMHLCNLGIPCIGIPGTIDNDLPYTEMTLGYDTAVNVCVDGVRMIRATSRSHDRVAVVEVMGRNCGDIALRTAVCTGAEVVVVPELPWSVEGVADRLNYLISHGNTRATVIVAEGVFQNNSMERFDLYGFLTAHNKPCYPGEKMSAYRLAQVLRYLAEGSEARSTVLGYIQRGSAPRAYDAAFAFEAGNLAVRLLRDGITEQVIGVKHGRVFNMPIREALEQTASIDRHLFNLVNRL